MGGLGDAIVRRNGEVVLVAGGAPGDVLALRDLGRRGGVVRAELVSVVRPGPARRKPTCAVAERCGGCAWQHVDDAVQTQLRRTMVARALGLHDAEVTTAAVAPLGYRRRARLHLRRAKGQLVAGYLAKGSEELVATAACPVLEPAVQAVLARAPEALATWVDRGELTLLLGADPDQHTQPRLVGHLTARPVRGVALPGDLAERIQHALGLDGVEVQLGPQAQRAGLQRVVLPETAETLPITATASGFAQASQAGNAAIRSTVQTLLQALATRRQQEGRSLQSATEWFAGSGNLSALLASSVRSLRVVEWDAPALARLQQALQPALAAGLQLQVHNADVGDTLQVLDSVGPDDLAVLDPGRPGAFALCNHWAKAPPAEQPSDIIYVSCAADTLQRDVRVLRDAGWQVQRGVLVDTYAQTPRVEVVTWLHKPVATP